MELALVPSSTLKQDTLISSLPEKISNLLSQWTALQMAVHNEWGGRDSRKKSDQLARDIYSCLFHSKAIIEVEHLENLLHERLLLVFNTEIEDGSIEEVAEQLMFLHEEYLQGNVAASQSKRTTKDCSNP